MFIHMIIRKRGIFLCIIYIPQYYNNIEIATKAVKFHRATKGYFIWCNSFLINIKTN